MPKSKSKSDGGAGASADGAAGGNSTSRMPISFASCRLLDLLRGPGPVVFREPLVVNFEYRRRCFRGLRRKLQARDPASLRRSRAGRPAPPRAPGSRQSRTNRRRPRRPDCRPRCRSPTACCPGDRGSAAPAAGRSGRRDFEAPAFRARVPTTVDQVNRRRRRGCRRNRPSRSTNRRLTGRPARTDRAAVSDLRRRPASGGGGAAAASCRPARFAGVIARPGAAGFSPDFNPSSSLTRLITTVGSTGFSSTPFAPLAARRASSTVSNAPDNSNTGTFRNSALPRMNFARS